MESKNPNEAELKYGANIYFALNIGITGIGEIAGISFGVTITNLTKENRYFNSPVFKLSSEFNGTDTFELMGRTHNILFPKKLEYGEVVTEDYPLIQNSKQVFEEVLKKDSEATLKVIVNTTIGEIYHSNQYKVSRILKHYDYSR